MNSAFYTSLSGMLAASYGLQNTSNNVANMQSPGFKRSDVFYSSLSSGSEQDHLGSGVRVGGRATNFNAGHYLATENPSDLAIVGNGFFIIKLKNGELLYTRDGEFGFNHDGLLIDKHSGGLVQGYDKKGALTSIHQFGARSSPGKATHSIDLSGELIITEMEQDSNNPDPFQSKYQMIKFDVTSVYDEKGHEHKVTLEFKASDRLPGNQLPEPDNLKWTLVSATCDGASITYDEQFIEFDRDVDGMPKQGANIIKLTLNGTQSVTLNFGDQLADAKTSVRLYKKDPASHVNSSIVVQKHDGYGIGRQIGFAFDDNGQISYQYDNGQVEDGIHVGIAVFDDEDHSLTQAHDNLFRAKTNQGRKIGRPNTHSFGTIQAKKLESSNVDSTIEFGNIVVLQRMFQACSQIMDIDKQLLEELYRR